MTRVIQLNVIQPLIFIFSYYEVKIFIYNKTMYIKYVIPE